MVAISRQCHVLTDREKKMYCRNAWRALKEHAAITVPGVVGVFAAVYVLMLAVHAGEVGAAWVQAIGSISAIIAAWLIPLMHERARQKRHQHDIYDSAGWLAVRISNTLNGIDETLKRAGAEEDPIAVIKSWRMFESLSSCEVQNKAAEELPLSAFSGWEISYLIAIRSSAAFCLECVKVIEDWDFESSPDIASAFPLYARLQVHQSQIDWAKEHTYNRPGSKLPRVTTN